MIIYAVNEHAPFDDGDITISLFSTEEAAEECVRIYTDSCPDLFYYVEEFELDKIN